MMGIFYAIRGIGARLDKVGSREYQNKGNLGFRLGEAGECEEPGVDDDEEAFGASQDGPVGALDFGLVEELAAFAAEVTAGED